MSGVEEGERAGVIGEGALAARAGFESVDGRGNRAEEAPSEVQGLSRVKCRQRVSEDDNWCGGGVKLDGE